jgi:hypothetical protein
MSKKKAVEKVVTKGTTETSGAPTNASPFSAENVADAAKLVDQAIAAINPGTPAMTVTDRRRTVKVRKGGEKYIPLLVEIATTYGISPPDGSVDEMTTQLAVVQLLVPLLRRAQVLLKLLEDTNLGANSAMWGTATYIYGAAKHMARRDGNVALALQPIEEFFANGPRNTTKAKKGAITTTTSATPGTIEAQPATTAAPTTPHT